MKVHVLTLFPDMIVSVLSASMLKRAQAKGLLEVCVHNLRDYTEDGRADDLPYGGGPGMLIKAQPILKAVAHLEEMEGPMRILLMSPQGTQFNQNFAVSLAREDRPILLICGHYEGIDARVSEKLIPEEISVGDYILTGGELAALVIMDAATRLIPGVLGDPASLLEESFALPLLEYPNYTRPYQLDGMTVPNVLRSGHHAKIRQWRREQSLLNTVRKRPDLLLSFPAPQEEGFLHCAKRP